MTGETRQLLKLAVSNTLKQRVPQPRMPRYGRRENQFSADLAAAAIGPVCPRCGDIAASFDVEACEGCGCGLFKELRRRAA